MFNYLSKTVSHEYRGLGIETDRNIKLWLPMKSRRTPATEISRAGVLVSVRQCGTTAFGHFAGGHAIERVKNDRLFMIKPEGVVEV